MATPHDKPVNIPVLGDDPPLYSEHGAKNPDEIVQPKVYVLHGRFIYGEMSAGVADSEPLYQLSRAIHAQGRATKTIDFQRLVYRVRTAADGSPVVSKRTKDVYTMHYLPPMSIEGLRFRARLLPDSRQTVGEVRIAKSPIFHSGYRAFRAVSDSDKARLMKEGKKVDKGEYHFVIKGGDGGAWQWTDPEGTLVAIQTRESSGDGGRAEHKLRVMAPLPRRILDSLVAMWCLWMWHWHITETTVRKTWEDRKRILLQPRPKGAALFH
ncbi:hypothetical protein VTK56DRAFT_8105 [Thermocarpiscus australiensis]